MKKSVLVTGADGLLGSHLVRALLADGFHVKALVEPASPATTLDGLDVERVEANLLADDSIVEEAVQGCAHVIHCAASTNLWAPADLVWKINLGGTRRMLSACEAAGVGRSVFVGSASSFQFGTIDNPGNESGDYPPFYRDIAYMESKHAAADLVRQYVREDRLDAVIVAPTFLLGEYDERPSSGELIRQFVKRGMRFVSPGGRNFAYAGDVARAMANALTKGTAGETYILGGENLTYLDFFTRAAGQVNAKAPIAKLPGALIRLAGQAGSAMERFTKKPAVLNKTLARLACAGTYYTSAKAISDLDMPQTPVDTAISASVGSLKQYGHIEDTAKDFKGKVALITGGSRGVGYATAKELLERGAKVVISARGGERLEDSRTKLEQIGEVAAVQGDVGNWDDVKRMVDEAADKFGKLDIVVANAGVSMRGQFTDLSPEVCHQVININLMGCVYTARAAVDHLVESKGSIVFISSIAGLFGLPGASVYCASKKALTGLSESLRLELLPKGVHSGVVYLGFTEHDPEKRILDADGSPVLPDRPAHHTQAYAARHIARMIQKRKRQLVLTPIGKVAWTAHKLSAWFVEKAILLAQSSRWGIFKRFS